jgi:hypothetical protein
VIVNKHLEDKPTAQILAFPGRKRTDLEKTAAYLRQAEASGRLAAAHFASCRDSFDWARTFRDRSEAVIESANIDEMVRVRDALAREWADRWVPALKIG